MEIAVKSENFPFLLGGTFIEALTSDLPAPPIRSFPCFFVGTFIEAPKNTASQLEN